ncbi:MAG: hypothetical protein HKN78_05300 [Sphingomonadaceae bacterium]|nr:hypothetical protein [Sphingomonadaceae bacterium]
MIRWAFLALAFAAAFPAAAQGGGAGDWPEIVSADEATLADLQRMAVDFPNSGLIQLRIAQAGIASDDYPTARAALWRYLRMGGALSEQGTAFVQTAFDEAEWALFAARMAANGSPLDGSRRAGEVPAENGLIEGVAHVPFMDNIVASSVTARAIFGRATAGNWERYARERTAADRLVPGSLMGMRYDFERGWLWVASSVVPQTPNAENAFSGMIGYGPDRNDVLWLATDQEDQPGDVALGPDGSAYLSGGGSGAVYVRRVGSVTLEQLIAPGRLRSPQGMEVSPDGSALIIADYSYGLARYDFATGALDQLGHDELVILDGIDGLSRHGDDLIAIRNGVRPHAILRISINPAGDTITAVERLERANPEWGEPTLGAVFDDTLYYIADARWPDYGDDGGLNDDAAPRATSIRALPLR